MEGERFVAVHRYVRVHPRKERKKNKKLYELLSLPCPACATQVRTLFCSCWKPGSMYTVHARPVWDALFMPARSVGRFRRLDGVAHAARVASKLSVCLLLASWVRVRYRMRGLIWNVHAKLCRYRPSKRACTPSVPFLWKIKLDCF